VVVLLDAVGNEDDDDGVGAAAGEAAEEAACEAADEAACEAAEELAVTCLGCCCLALAFPGMKSTSLSADFLYTRACGIAKRERSSITCATGTRDTFKVARNTCILFYFILFFFATATIIDKG